MTERVIPHNELTQVSLEKITRLYETVGEKRMDGAFGFYEAAGKAIYHRNNFSAFLEGRLPDVKPVSLEIVPSLDCNLNCPGCTYSQNQSKAKDTGLKHRFLTQETFIKVINGAKDLDVKSLIFTGGGEPTLNPGFIDYMQQAKDESFDIGLYTNGTLLNKQRIERLLELNPTFVRVSLNAGTPETHAVAYGYNPKAAQQVFVSVVNNIIELGKAKKRMGTDTTIGIGFIVNGKNYQDLPQLAQLMLRVFDQSDGGIDYIAFRPEVCYFDDNLQVVKQQPNAAVFEHIDESLDEKVTQIVKPIGMRVLINKEGFRTLSQPYLSVPNIATSWSASTDYDGRIYITSEHNGMPGFDMGDLNRQSATDIWYGEKRQELMREMETGQILQPPHFKLASLNHLLIKIRNLGKFSQAEVDEFYKNIVTADSPMHVNFI